MQQGADERRDRTAKKGRERGGLLWRGIEAWTSASAAGRPTLVRHIYDLHVIRDHYDSAEAISLAREIMLADAEAYGHQFPAYRENPIAETVNAVAGLSTDPEYARRFALF